MWQGFTACKLFGGFRVLFRHLEFQLNVPRLYVCSTTIMINLGSAAQVPQQGEVT